MKTGSLIVAAIVLLTLSGCAPSTDEAYTKCAKYGTSLIDISKMSEKEYVDQLVVVAEACRLAAETDPVGFNKDWN